MPSINIWMALLLASMFGPLYALFMGGLLKRHSPTPFPERDSYVGPTRPVPRVICLVPCLNEGLVVAETVRRLLRLDPTLTVVVVDDASDDDTPLALAAVRSDRVRVVRRELPNARLGKGAALNQALASVSHEIRFLGEDPANIVVAVFDGDGNADSNALEAILPWFDDSGVGAVQIGVRINNRSQSLLARFQDIEFAAYTEIFQHARNVLTSTGLGGNGQFVRLSALESLGPLPWSDCLTEDLDLGIRLRMNGWRSIFEGSVAVHQQGLHQFRRLVRQRTRWFQGHLQTWSLLPSLWKSNIPFAAKLDMSGHLVLPVLMLLISLGVLASTVALVRNLIVAPADTLTLLMAGPGLPWWYLLGFIATPLIAGAYWRVEPQVGFVRGLVLAHGYSFYSFIWVPAGWQAVYRQLLDRGGWAKTERAAEIVVGNVAVTTPSFGGPIIASAALDGMPTTLPDSPALLPALTRGLTNEELVIDLRGSSATVGVRSNVDGWSVNTLDLEPAVASTSDASSSDSSPSDGALSDGALSDHAS